MFCVTITSGLSGSYNAACIAKQMYEAEKLRGMFPKADIRIGACRGLCSYYAENGSLLVAYERM